MDRELVARAQRGDESAFEMLATASHARLYRVARGVLRDDDGADDAVQRTLVQMWRKLPQLRDPDRFEGWSYRLVVNACRDEARRSHPAVPVAPLDASRTPVAQDELHRVEDLDELEHGFARLSVEHRAVIVLRYLLDLSTDQVAEALDVPPGTVASRLHRAMSELRAALEADARPASAGQRAQGALR
ncbi:MAG: sigma-70 family RNA polymerase sigma factor [Candidatus Limnocylindrales bacterium]